MAEEEDLPEIELPELELPEAELPEVEPLPLEGGEAAEAPEALAVEEEPIQLTGKAGEEPARKIQAFGGGKGGFGAAPAKRFKRALNLSGAGATRCRIFHSKIGPGPIEYLENQINEWLDENDIEVKFVTEVVGIMEGKTAEPNLLLTVWY